MGLLNFSRNKKEQNTGGSSFHFSSDVLGNDRNLSKPLIKDNFTSGRGMVYFGEDNLYPNAINELYNISGIHSACVNFKRNTIVGGGFEWKNKPSNLNDTKELKVFELKSDLQNLIDKLSIDFVKHGRAILLLRIVNKKPVRVINVDPEKVRNEKNTIFSDFDRYYISEDFELFGQGKEFTKYHPKNKDEWQVLELRSVDGYRETYPLPSYVGASNWIYLDGEQSYLQKQGIINSINPSLSITYPFETTPEEKRRIASQFRNKGKGAKNYGRVLTFFGKNKDQVPTIQSHEPSKLDSLYFSVGNSIKENIAMAHQMNPSLSGVAMSGKLGNNQEILTHYNLFEKNWGIKNRMVVQDFVNKLISIWGINNRIEFNEYALVDDEIKEE